MRSENTLFVSSYIIYYRLDMNSVQTLMVYHSCHSHCIWIDGKKMFYWLHSPFTRNRFIYEHHTFPKEEISDFQITVKENL